jgi:hypothetical protein
MASEHLLDQELPHAGNALDQEFSASCLLDLLLQLPMRQHPASPAKPPSRSIGEVARTGPGAVTPGAGGRACRFPRWMELPIRRAWNIHVRGSARYLRETSQHFWKFDEACLSKRGIYWISVSPIPMLFFWPADELTLL